jgi:radical SAM superfamily enzyme YgiQ (UPF0313 family)
MIYSIIVNRSLFQSKKGRFIMQQKVQAIHPKGTRATMLLTSVFGPYAQDDEYGSRKINPMELYQNQVTRHQGGFSLRMFHRSFGLLMLQANIDAPCSLLDFPSREDFIREIKDNKYDVIGIGAIIPNIGKVKSMCELIREHCPKTTIVVGGHISNMANIDHMLDADYIVRGDGIQWFRKYLGQDEKAPVRHPMVYSGFGGRTMGINLPQKPNRTAAILIPSVGCPMGCNFCSTSALFGGKGNFINFYETGDDLFSVMCQIEKELSVRSFFVLDENFLFHKKRSLRLLELMEEKGKSWALYVFSSARVLKSYTVEQLVGLGIAWVWLGLEGESSVYKKLEDVQTHELVKNLQNHGIRVLGSSIIGLENHTPENIDEVIEHAVSHDTDFHQFMLYTPNPGTPLYEQHKNNGTLLSESEFPLADTHGQFRFNYRHPHIKDGKEEEFLLRAFRRDFEANGPSLYRLIRTTLKGWQKYKNCSDSRIRNRFNWDAAPLRTAYAGAIWAMKKWYQGDERMVEKMDTLLTDIYKTFGWKTRIIAPLFGRYALATLKGEEKRLKEGWLYEPDSHFEKNRAALALEHKGAAPVAIAIPETPYTIQEPVSAPGT